MILFNEGLPRSGKSYEAVSVDIARALKNGREVVAYIEGIGTPESIAKLSAAIDVPGAVIKELLHPITRDQVENIRKHNRRNALHVIDEAQNFWGNKAKLDQDFVQFVAEHGHRGEDWLLMGQDMRDVHVLWRRRVEIRRRYLKLSGLGLENRYAVTTERCVGPDQFEPVGQSITNTYNEKFFGTYKSHVDQDVNTSNFKDARSTIWSKPAIKYGFPVLAVVTVLAVWQLVTFFKDPSGKLEAMKAKEQAKTVAAAASAASSPWASPQAGWAQQGPAPAPVGASVASQAASAPKREQPAEERFIREALNGGNRLRYAGLVWTPGRQAGLLEVRDAAFRVRERLTLEQLRDMGVEVSVKDGYVKVKAGEFEEVVTQWPIEPPEGQVPAKRLEEVRDASVAPAAGWSAIGGSTPEPAPQLAEPAASAVQPRVRRPLT